MADGSRRRGTLGARLEQFRRNVLADLELHTSTDPKEILQIAAESLEQSDFVRSARAYLLKGQTLTCVTGRPTDDLTLSQSEHPAVGALGKKLISHYRVDGYIDFAAPVGPALGPRGVIHVVLTRENLDAQLLVRHLFQAASDRLCLLQPLAPEGLTTEARRRPITRGNLLAYLVHEINNPLAAILAHLEVLRMDRGGDLLVTEHLEALIPEVKRLAGILDAARTYARAAPDVAGRVDLREGLRALAALLKPHYSANGAELQLVIPQELPSITGNAARLQQAWLNYLNNALNAVRSKHPPGGSIRVKVSHNKSLSQIVVEITDDGVGMDAETLKILNSARWTAMPGIGTREAARIVAEHKGHAVFTSEPGRGTTVRIVLLLPAPNRTSPFSGVDS